MAVTLKEVAPPPGHEHSPYRAQWGRPWIYLQLFNTVFLGQPGMHHDDVLASIGRLQGYSGVVAFGDVSNRGIEWYRSDDGVPREEISKLLGHPLTKRVGPDWHFAARGMKVVKLNNDPADHGTGRPIIYHPHTNTAYVGVPGSYHENLQSLIDQHGLAHPMGQDIDHWRMGPDGMVDFYHELNGSTPLPAEFRQHAIDALGAKGEHSFDTNNRDTSWYFSKRADFDAPNQPPVPQTPDDYWKAVTIDGQHHVFPGDTKSHLQHVLDLKRTPQDVTDYWGWSPYMGRWENFNRFQQDYRDIWDGTQGQDPDWQFDFPTKESSYAPEELPEGLQPYADGGHGFERWEPGHMGKGVVIHDPDPRLITWKVPDILSDQAPHHGDFTGLMNSDAPHSRPHIETSNEIWIDRDGRYRNYFGDDAVPSQLDPRLKLEGNPIDWFRTGADDDEEPLSTDEINPMTDQDILDLLTPEPTPGVAQKGLEAPDGDHWFWVPADDGSPHHQEVAQVLGWTDPNVVYLKVDPDGTVRDIYADPSDDDWQF